MKIIILSLIICFTKGALAIEGNSPSAASDCVLKGQGNVYILDVTGSYKKDENNSYVLSALRFPLAPGSYLYQETKIFADGRPNQKTMFKQTNSVASYNYSAPDGSIKSSGVCVRVGHCVGTISIPAVKFTGRMTTDYDASGIRTVTFSDDGSFVDEVLTPIDSCEF
jgi:hypothetical protein